MFVELFQNFGPRFRPEDVYAATLFGRMAALDAGVTTLLDWAHIQNSSDHPDEGIRALEETKGRSSWMFDSILPHPADIGRIRDRGAGHGRSCREY